MDTKMKENKKQEGQQQHKQGGKHNKNQIQKQIKEALTKTGQTKTMAGGKKTTNK